MLEEMRQTGKYVTKRVENKGNKSVAKIKTGQIDDEDDDLSSEFQAQQMDDQQMAEQQMVEQQMNQQQAIPEDFSNTPSDELITE
jgi:hypothetical protein